MKTFRVDKVCDPLTIHNALEAAGVPVITVRGGHAKIGEPAMYAVIVTEDSANAGVVNSVIASHIEVRRPSRTKPDHEKEADLKKLEHIEDGSWREVNK